MRDDLAEILFQLFLQDAIVSSLTWAGMSTLDVHPAFPLLTTAWPTLQGTLKDDFGEAVRVFDMPKQCKFLSFYSCLKRFLWTHKEVVLAPHAVVGFVLLVGDTENFFQARGFESLGSFLKSPQAGSIFHSRRGRWWQCLLHLEKEKEKFFSWSSILFPVIQFVLKDRGTNHSKKVCLFVYAQTTTLV